MTNERRKWDLPLWVTISLLVGVIAAVAFVIFHLAGNGMAGMHG